MIMEQEAQLEKEEELVRTKEEKRLAVLNRKKPKPKKRYKRKTLLDNLIPSESETESLEEVPKRTDKADIINNAIDDMVKTVAVKNTRKRKSEIDTVKVVAKRRKHIPDIKHKVDDCDAMLILADAASTQTPLKNVLELGNFQINNNINTEQLIEATKVVGEQTDILPDSGSDLLDISINTVMPELTNITFLDINNSNNNDSNVKPNSMEDNICSQNDSQLSDFPIGIVMPELTNISFGGNMSCFDSTFISLDTSANANSNIFMEEESQCPDVSTNDEELMPGSYVIKSVPSELEPHKTEYKVFLKSVEFEKNVMKPVDFSPADLQAVITDMIPVISSSDNDTGLNVETGSGNLESEPKLNDMLPEDNEQYCDSTFKVAKAVERIGDTMEDDRSYIDETCADDNILPGSYIIKTLPSAVEANKVEYKVFVKAVEYGKSFLKPIDLTPDEMRKVINNMTPVEDSISNSTANLEVDGN